MADKIIKRIELKIKKMLDGFIFGKKEPEIIKHQIFDLKSINKILLLRQDRLGDLLISSSFVRNLKLINPNLKIDIILSKKNVGGLFCIKDYINDYYIYDKKISTLFNFAKEFSLKKYDAVIDLFDNPSTSSSLFLKYIKNTKKIGFEKKNRNSYDYVIPLPDKNIFHPIERMFSFYKLFGIDYNQLDLKLDFSNFKQKIIKNNIAINISGSNRAKYWGIKNHIELIKLINNKYTELIVNLYGTKDYENDLKIIKSETNSEIIKFTNSFEEYATNLSQNEYIITPDTSAVHLAAGFEIPCLVFYELNDFAKPWTPYKSQYEMVTTKNQPIQSISPNEAFDAFEKLINKEFE